MVGGAEEAGPTRLGLPAEGPTSRVPLSLAHWSYRRERGTGCSRCVHRGDRSRSDLRLYRRAALSMMPGAPLLRLLTAVSAAAAVAVAPGTAMLPTTGDATLAFVFDVTGSMWDDLMQVIDGASRILERSLSRRSQAIVNYALVPFHDPGSAPARWTPLRGALTCPTPSVGLAPNESACCGLHCCLAGTTSRHICAVGTLGTWALLAAVPSLP
ncbi:hypothetical protein P7K49_001842 [Saguinus oedipus]|uniref:Hemicentin-1-like von Willebrand factor A domain-containing protein n=1 Tax=Saguinus oedipus TaxID=9490 RepID=A0ABQ9WGM0_SAGOE|nr:hypothetical protein P7K49_001842 [Saguinus oedipus]